VILVSILAPGSGFATQQESISTITHLYAYTQYGGGDVVVQVASSAPVCTKGFWLSPDDDGFKSTYALLLSAYHTQSLIRIAGDDTQIWSGSTDVYCRMTFAGMDN
jgi:hypothetical protein